MSNEELLTISRRAQKNAHAPYSKIFVGAALLCGSGKVYTGCNIENAVYPAGICAERVAFSKAVSEGEKIFEAIAVTSNLRGALTPCGLCRQFMAEFSPGLRVIFGSPENAKEMLLSELLPAPPFFE